MHNGMQAMVHRTTFALDKTTAQRLKRLASRWNVSQAEVVRRSVEQAEKQTEAVKPDPVAMLRELFTSGGGLDPEKGNAYITEVYKDRKYWRGE
jgi:predicted transcriptional regulator